jgi:hypothetical protein
MENGAATALARFALYKKLVSSQSDGVLINFPNRETRILAAGPSNELAKYSKFL